MASLRERGRRVSLSTRMTFSIQPIREIEQFLLSLWD
jgi:hypothetical protein